MRCSHVSGQSHIINALEIVAINFAQTHKITHEKQFMFIVFHNNKHVISQCDARFRFPLERLMTSSNLYNILHCFS